ncbi:MAG: nitroreductase [Lachnospiraceae bacterium]|nr:nitroreductase [Lachnospiraceae bacterium]MBR3360065.1 nitroreductase [Lachnospiraceae bacterium]MBR7076979.1 nitroreductase [Lachnospiraceae bacterium]
MDALEAIKTRRSTRKFKEDMPPRELLDKIIEAGRYAPSGHNSQTTHLIVITDKKIHEEITAVVKDALSKMEAGPDTYVSLKYAIEASKKDGYTFFYQAPVLIVAANKKGYGNALADTGCVLENMMIAANALDLGSCWINNLHWLDENEQVREYLYQYGLEKDETITGGLAVGYAFNGLPERTPLERKGNPVTWVGSDDLQRPKE